MPKLRQRWEPGLWLGKVPSSDEHLVGLVQTNTTIAARDCRRIPWQELPTCDWQWWFRPQSVFGDLLYQSDEPKQLPLTQGAEDTSTGQSVLPQPPKPSSPMETPLQRQPFSIPRTGASSVQTFPAKNIFEQVLKSIRLRSLSLARSMTDLTRHYWQQMNSGTTRSPSLIGALN